MKQSAAAVSTTDLISANEVIYLSEYMVFHSWFLMILLCLVITIHVLHCWLMTCAWCTWLRIKSCQYQHH